MPRLTLPVLAAFAVYYAFSAAVGAMLPPKPGEERTTYGFWFRFLQTLAANGHRLKDAGMLPAIAEHLAAREEAWHFEPLHALPLDMRTYGGYIDVPVTSNKEIHRIMANKVETFFEKIGSWLKAHFTKAPAFEVQVSSVVNYVVPFVEELDTLIAPEIAPIVNPLIDKIKTGLAALATTITDSSAAGVANVKSILASLQTNAAALESAFQVKDAATQAKITGTIQLLNGEFSAIAAQLALSAPSAA